MATINFKKEHFERMKELAIEMLLDNGGVQTKMGQHLGISELLHTTTIITLNSIRVSIDSKIKTLNNQDEWTASDATQREIADLTKTKELVNLIIGYKRYNMEKEQTEIQRFMLKEELKSLKDAQKTPEDKIKEIEEKLSSLDSAEF